MKNKFVKSLVWASLGRFTKHGIQYFFLIILARFLTPEEFGLLGLGMVVIRISSEVGQVGMGPALISRNTVAQKDIDTAFWISFTINITLSILVYFFAEIFANFYSEPQVKQILRWLCLIYLFKVFGIIPNALLERNLEFKLLAWVDTISEICFGIVGLILTLFNYGVYSLIYATISREAVRVITLTLLSPWKFNFSFDLATSKTLISFGLPVVGATFFSQIAANADYIIIGRYIGVTEVGYYTLAFQLIISPIQQLINVIRLVVFPTLSRIKEYEEAFTSTFRNIFISILILLLPVVNIMTLGSGDIISIFYTSDWLSTIPVAKAMAPAILFLSFDITAAVYYAMNKPLVRFYITGIRLTAFILLAIFYGVANGIIGIAISLSLSIIISGVFSYIFLTYQLKMDTKKLLHTLRWPLIASIVSYLSTQNILNILSSFQITSHYSRLAICVLSCLLLYTLVLLLSKQHKPLLAILKISNPSMLKKINGSN